MRQFENIDTVIRDIVALDGYNYEVVARSVKRAFQYLRDENLVDDGIKYFNSIKSSFVTIKSNLTADLPKDCAEVLKVGYVFNDLGRSETRYLGRRRFIHRQDLKSSEIIFPACACCDEDIQQVTQTTNQTLLTDYERQTLGLESYIFHNLPVNIGYGEAYNHRPVMYPNGIYTVDLTQNILVFDSGTDIQIGNQLIVEYKTELTAESYKYIPLIAFDALRYKALSYLLDNENAKELNRINFNKEVYRLRSAAKPITIDDLMQLFSGGSYLRFRS